MGRHVVLFGDSIFDNSAYIGGGPDVAALLRAELDDGDQVTLLAFDGSICCDTIGQFADCPPDATHAIISAGGNDILHHAGLLTHSVGSIAEALTVLAAASDGFAPEHGQMVEAVRKLALPVAVCTIYDANMGPLITSALSLFNDAITRNVHSARLDLIDLRLVCPDPDDYANPIEPSVQGGAKIPAAIARYVRAVDAPATCARVFV
jgi:hypothetical protein